MRAGIRAGMRAGGRASVAHTYIISCLCMRCMRFCHQSTVSTIVCVANKNNIYLMYKIC